MQTLSRDNFVSNYFDYYPGEHLQVIGSTGVGKTHLIGQLLGQVNREMPSLKVTYLVPKAVDPSMADWSKKLGYKTITTWPPKKPFWGSEPQGHVLWPPHIRNDAAANSEHLGKVFRQPFNDSLWSGHNIIVADDCYGLAAEKKLNHELNRHWTEGRSAESGLWSALQQPKGTVQGGVSSYAYSQPSHLFFGRENTKANLDRISEIGISTVDPEYVKSIVSSLRVTKINGSNVSELLYVNRGGPYCAIIGV